MPQRRGANGNVQPGQTTLSQFRQGQIRLGFDPALQLAIMGSQTGTAIASNLFGQALAGSAMLLPKAFNTFAADTKSFTDLAGAFATFPCRDNPLS